MCLFARLGYFRSPLSQGNRSHTLFTLGLHCLGDVSLSGRLREGLSTGYRRTRDMETLCPPDIDRASEISLGLEDEAPLETSLDPEETEQLTESLKEVVQNEDVKPKLQCLMSSPSFSMVTVQCEDSGIHWETSSSRCSTPWASEASTTSDVYSMESSGSVPGSSQRCDLGLIVKEILQAFI
ncbi:hypothetical protein GDO86_011409 [Hymenochirus boettgeri]|uniref:Uncharacterized protein n=1 Tax=Hymenochirus boettgeri TaxID=247094 RepID=A0A8T2JJ19_9PIPI|nr:hypothetical protein GDO86_011409 [Hymenochirus boettgeri]